MRARRVRVRARARAREPVRARGPTRTRACPSPWWVSGTGSGRAGRAPRGRNQPLVMAGHLRQHAHVKSRKISGPWHHRRYPPHEQASRRCVSCRPAPRSRRRARHRSRIRRERERGSGRSRSTRRRLSDRRAGRGRSRPQGEGRDLRRDRGPQQLLGLRGPFARRRPHRPRPRTLQRALPGVRLPRPRRGRRRPAVVPDLHPAQRLGQRHRHGEGEQGRVRHDDRHRPLALRTHLHLPADRGRLRHPRTGAGDRPPDGGYRHHGRLRLLEAHL